MKPCKSIVSSFVHQATVSGMILRKFEKRPPNKHSEKKINGNSFFVTHYRSKRVACELDV